MENFGLSNEDGQDRDYGILQIKGEPDDPGFTWKITFKTVILCYLFISHAAWLIEVYD